MHETEAVEWGLCINHIGQYQDELGVEKRSISAWTTLDAQVAVPLDRWMPMLPGSSKALLSVMNLMDLAPPEVEDPELMIGYVPSNADPYGRTLSLQVSAHW